MKRKEDENASKNTITDSRKMRTPDVKYVSAYFNTVGGNNVVVIPKRKSNEIEMIDTHNDMKSLNSLPSELRSDAYRRKADNNTWKPPKSLFRFEPLLQEYYVYDPWRVLVVSVLLNRTTGVQVRRVLSNLFYLCPNAKSCIEVEVGKIEQVIRTLGLQNNLAKALQRLSHEYLYGSWTHVTQLHCVGKYVGDAYAIFCTGEWRNVTPTDEVLLSYWNFLSRIM
ncbi:PREDICTED: methyl-CpG-binding domain protein 4-like protein [Lupinus angustifolius]|uniref:methyl-CpG-binding domain protein 4-like protein n=1 Tax=Lupinus angustifolius TaxID=3871 RepID=UPI00092EF982|nr:PREDICTED: methyl-CpG-binding domain protein 4-like protein [Lupinus angustifolius]